MADASQTSAHGGLRSSELLSPPLKPTLGHPVVMKGHACGSPMSQASTMPPTPLMDCNFPDFEHFAHSRQLSPMSSICLEEPHFLEGSIPEDLLFGLEAAEPSESTQEWYDEEGMKWTVVVGTGAPSTSNANEEEVESRSALAGGRFQTLSRSHHQKLQRRYRQDAPTVSDLEASLAEVKALFEQKYGEAVDEEALVDEDGMRWKVTVGTGVSSKSQVAEEKTAQAGGRFQTLSRSHHQKLQRRYRQDAPTVSDLEASLAEVKALFEQKYGEAVDEEALVDEDGMRWKVTIGTGVSSKSLVAEEKTAQAGGRFQTLSRSHHQKLQRRYRQDAPTVSDLEASLAEVKALFEQKYGEAVDEEALVDEDGMRWRVTVGTGVSSRLALSEAEVEFKRLRAGSRFETLSASHQKMLERMYRKDGEAPPSPPEIPALEAKLEEVKALYKQRYGRDVDDEAEAC